MARSSTASAPKGSARKDKEPGRLRQMWRVLKMTRRYDPNVVWLLVLALIVPLGAGVVLGLLLSPGNVLGLILYIIAGLMGGILVALIVLGRRAEKAAYAQIAGEPGAVGAVLKSGLRRGWVGNEMPVTVSPKTKDAVYRAVGRGGVALIAEGPRSRTRRMLEDERRNVNRIVPNVETHLLYVGPDADSTPLHRLAPTLGRYPKRLTKAEVAAVSNRLASLSRGGMGGIGVPKGIDPTKIRAPRPR